MKINKLYLGLLSNLSSIQASVLITKQGDKLSSMHSSLDQTIFYDLKAPTEFFEFESDYVGFHTYSEFYSIFKAFEDPTVKQPSDTLLKVGKGRSMINYGLTPENSVRGKFTTMEEPPYEVAVDLTTELLNLIRSRSSLISSKFVKFTIEDGNLALKTFDINNPSNEWNHIIEESEVDNNVDLDANFPIEAFSTIPKGSYKMQISTHGLCKFTLDSEEFELDVFAVGADV